MYIDKNGTKKGHVRNNDVIQVSIETFVLKKKEIILIRTFGFFTGENKISDILVTLQKCF